MFPWVLEHFLVWFLQEDFELEAHLPLTPSLLHLKLKVIGTTISYSGQRVPIFLPLYLVPLFDIIYYEIYLTQIKPTYPPSIPTRENPELKLFFKKIIFCSNIWDVILVSLNWRYELEGTCFFDKLCTKCHDYLDIIGIDLIKVDTGGWANVELRNFRKVLLFVRNFFYK